MFTPTFIASVMTCVFSAAYWWPAVMTLAWATAFDIQAADWGVWRAALTRVRRAVLLVEASNALVMFHAVASEAETKQLQKIVIRALRDLSAAEGQVTNGIVKIAADDLGITGRHVRRLIRHDPKPRKGWIPSFEHMIVLYAARGSVSKAYRICKNEHKHGNNDLEVPASERTFRRGFRNHADQALVAGAKKGYAGLRAARASNRREIPHKGFSYAIDHSPINLVMRRDENDTEADLRFYETTIIDENTRFELMVVTYEGAPTTSITVEALARSVEGYETKDGVHIGGRPGQVMSDNGPDLRTSPMVAGLVVKGIQRVFSVVGNPQQNGRVERRQGSGQRSVQAGLPGYINPDLSEYERQAAKKYWRARPEQCITLDDYTVLRRREQEDYNFYRPHSELAGKTPYEAWCEDDTQLPAGDPVAIRMSMTKTDTRKVQGGGTIHIHGDVYYPEVNPDNPPNRYIDFKKGLEVTVRWFAQHGAPAYVYVDLGDDQYLRCRGASGGGGLNDAALAAHRQQQTSTFLQTSSDAEKLTFERTIRELKAAGIDVSHIKPPEPGESPFAERVPGRDRPGPKSPKARKTKRPVAPPPAPTAEDRALYDEFVTAQRQSNPFA